MGGLLSKYDVDTSLEEQGSNAPNEGSSADVQSLSKKVDDVAAENGHLRENIAALSTKIDQNIPEISHWKAETEKLPVMFQDVLGPEVNTMNAKYQALSTKIDNGLNDSPPAVNRGLAIGLSLGLGIPLTIAIVFMCVLWIYRRHPRLPEPSARKTQDTENWINLYHATRPRSLAGKIRSILESLRLLRKPVVQEVYMMEDGAKISK
ncbi:hypothetical protein N7527_005091 [Penicillium freii]|nr:hypothetical protein N7527_005091 [Penicillium freii]